MCSLYSTLKKHFSDEISSDRLCDVFCLCDKVAEEFDQSQKIDTEPYSTQYKRTRFRSFWQYCQSHYPVFFFKVLFFKIYMHVCVSVCMDRCT